MFFKVLRERLTNKTRKDILWTVVFFIMICAVQISFWQPKIPIFGFVGIYYVMIFNVTDVYSWFFGKFEVPKALLYLPYRKEIKKYINSQMIVSIIHGLVMSTFSAVAAVVFQCQYLKMSYFKVERNSILEVMSFALFLFALIRYCCGRNTKYITGKVYHWKSMGITFFHYVCVIVNYISYGGLIYLRERYAFGKETPQMFVLLIGIGLLLCGIHMVLYFRHCNASIISKRR